MSTRDDDDAPPDGRDCDGIPLFTGGLVPGDMVITVSRDTPWRLSASDRAAIRGPAKTLPIAVTNQYGPPLRAAALGSQRARDWMDAQLPRTRTTARTLQRVSGDTADGALYLLEVSDWERLNVHVCAFCGSTQATDAHCSECGGPTCPTVEYRKPEGS